MLSISQPLKGGGAAEYYLDLARDDYYLQAPEAPGRWFGQGAALLGLTGQVKGDDFRHVMDGRSPGGSLALVQNAGKPDRQSGWDLTFSAPKSVSVLWAMAPPQVRDQIESIHHRAVETALTHLEQTAALTRRGQGGRTVEPAAVMFATFQHRTSRSQDPQLHTHAVLVNLGLREDGTTGSVLSRPFFQQKLALGAMYRTELAAGLQRELGITVEPDRVGFHVAGVPRPLCRHFSQRRQQIERQLEERGDSGAVAAKVAALDTRTAKTATPAENLFAVWQEIGNARGWGPSHAETLIRPPSQQQQHDHGPFEQELADVVTAAAKVSLEPRRVLPHATQAAVRHGADARMLLDGLAETLNGVRPQMPRWLQVQWQRVFDSTPWIKARGKFVYTETFQPFAKSWWRPARELRLTRVRVELPQIRLGSRSRRFQPKWWEIYWKANLGIGELRVQQRFLFPHAPRWSPLQGLSLPAVRFTTNCSKWQPGRIDPSLDQGHSH